MPFFRCRTVSISASQPSTVAHICVCALCATESACHPNRIPSHGIAKQWKRETKQQPVPRVAPHWRMPCDTHRQRHTHDTSQHPSMSVARCVSATTIPFTRTTNWLNVYILQSNTLDGFAHVPPWCSGVLSFHTKTHARRLLSFHAVSLSVCCVACRSHRLSCASDCGAASVFQVAHRRQCCPPIHNTPPTFNSFKLFPFDSQHHRAHRTVFRGEPETKYHKETRESHRASIDRCQSCCGTKYRK